MNADRLHQLQKALSQIPIGLLWASEEGGIIHANHKIAFYLNKSPSDPQAHTLFELAPHLNLISWKKIWAQLLETGAYRLETEFLSCGEVLFPVCLHLSILKNGNDTFALAFVEDLYERTRLEGLIRLLAKSGESGFWEFDLVREQYTIGGAYLSLLGLDGNFQALDKNKLEELLEQKITAQSFSLLSQQIARAIKEGVPFEQQLKLLPPSESQTWVLTCEVEQSELSTTRILGTIRNDNATGHPVKPAEKKAPSKAEGQKLLLSKLTLDTTTDLIFWVSSQGKVFFANDAAHKLLGYEPKTLAGKKFSSLLTSPDIADNELPDQPTFEAAFDKRKGGKLLVEINWNTVSLDGQGYGCFIARDITERKRKEKELEEANQIVAELSSHLQEENLTLREEVFSNYNFNNIITCSKSYRKVLNQVAQVADTGATVLITGETGTGKELLARAIYSLSDREAGPFVKVNCAALPSNLIESELFGHEKGAFTGAIQQRKGRFEIANRGTIFLDEIGEMPLSLQPKLLRVLQEGEFERVGGTKTIKVDVRVIAATNRQLEKMVEKGKFREDLYYRLNVFPIYNIPLRSRPEDIPVLVRHFANKYCKQSRKTIEKIAQADIEQLLQYNFPGNVRELENLIERAVILTKGNKLNIKDSFVPSNRNNKPHNKDFLSFESMQREHIVKALEQTKWRITGPKGAARLLGLKDRTLMSKMRKLGINREDYV